MPRPTSKTDLLAAISQERGALEATLETLTLEQMEEAGAAAQQPLPPERPPLHPARAAEPGCWAEQETEMGA